MHQGARVTFIQQEESNHHPDDTGRGHEVATHDKREVRLDVETVRDEGVLSARNEHAQHQRKSKWQPEDPLQERIAAEETHIGQGQGP